MKNRNGFVSNSSTSSFFIYGVTIDFNDLPNVLTEEAIKILKDDYFKRLNESGNIEDKKDPEKVDDKRYIYGVYRSEVCEVLKIPHTYCGEEGYVAVGYSPEAMKEDETKAQFKARVESEIKKYFNVSEFAFQEGEYCS